MLCGILEGFGVTFGASHLLYQGDEYNRDGYFEIKEIRLIYEKLFSEICSSWRSTALLKEEIFEKEKAARADYYAGWIADSVEKCMGGVEKLWGFKEPSTSLLLPLVKRSFSFLKRKPLYAVMVRNPIEVAASLRRREGMEEGQALRLYMKYYISILKHMKGEEAVFFQKEELVSKKEQAFWKLDSRIFSGELSAKEKTAEELEKYVKTEYFHADYGNGRVQKYGNALLQDLYDYLNLLCRRDIPIEKWPDGSQSAGQEEGKAAERRQKAYRETGEVSVYEKALEFERRYRAEIGEFGEKAVQDAYAEAEYRKEQMESFAEQLTLYRQWLKNKMYNVDCLTFLEEKGIKKLGVYGEGETCSFFLKACAETAGKTGIETVYYNKGDKRETECPIEIPQIQLPSVVRTDAVVIADSGRKADAERSGEFIREYLRAGAAECEILYLDELLKDSYEEEMYRREKDRKNIDAGRNGMKEWQGTKEENQKKGILIFKSRSLCYASTDYFAERLAEAFEKSGYRADILDFDNEGDIRLEEALKREYSALFDFNSDLPKAYMEDGRHYLDCFHAPFFQILLDHPMYFHASLKENLKEEYVCCIDEGHAEYVKRYYPNVKGAFCMPIPGIPAGDLEKLPSLEERKMDIFLPATYENPEKYEQEIGQAIPDIQEGIWDIINQMKKTPELSMEKALENMLVSQEMDCLDRKGKATIFHAHFLADMYINAYYREKAVKELLKSGIKIHACGQGWERFVCEGRENLTVIPAVDFKEISGLMKQAKIVLNIAYAFKNGCHDRVLSTMLAGAVSVTSKSPYMEMHFSEEDLVFYRMGELEKLPELLRETARNINGLKRIAQNGYRKAAEEYTWEKRVQEFMDLVDRQHE